MAKGHMRDRGNGKWQLEVDLGSYVDPKTSKKKRHKQYRTIKAKGPRDAQKALTKFVAEVTDDAYYEPEKMNFVDFINKEWLPKCGRKRLASTTLENYVLYLETRILPAFQFLRMDQIKPKHIIDFLHNLEDEGMRRDKYKDEKRQEENKKKKLSSSTIFYHYRILNNVFNFAQEIQLIKDNPVKHVKKPKVEHKQLEVYEIDEVIHLLECLEKETKVPHWQIIVKLAITTGMRRSELFGLEFKHFDHEKKLVHIRQALTYTKVDGYQVYDIKKGSQSAKQRDVVISEALLAEVKKLELQRKKERLAAKELWRDGKHNFILADMNGKPFNPESLKNWWERFIKRHDLKYIKIHALRHTSATLLINDGVHAKIMAERLGHANIKTTMNIYAHALRQADEIASQKLDDALNRKNKNG
ncbi:site-specific integrase [Gracilibacillus oryzae]|nr:site-specific integrase [Gracilibacillus oryzae]